MITIPADKYNVIPLGRLGENERTRILFKEAAEWKKEYPQGIISVLNQTPGAASAYPITQAKTDMREEGL